MHQLVWVLGLVCGGCLDEAEEHVRTGVPSQATGSDSASEDTASEDTAGGREDSASEGGSGPCGADMVHVPASTGLDGFCIDVVEASLEEWNGGGWEAASPYQTVAGREVRAVATPGAMPQGYISGDEAAAACSAADKRLCTSEEWLQACKGPASWTWPYGDTYTAGACNDDYAGSHPVVDYFGTSENVWDTASMNDPGINQQDGTVATGGAHESCLSALGAYDMHGNLHEWVDDSDGTFRGGFYADASINGSGCSYTTTAHSSGYHDYSTGFRCCREP